MFKIIEFIEKFTKIISENLERKVNRSTFLKTTFSAVFLSLMTFSVTKPAFAASNSWCQITYSGGTCNFPNGRVCSGCSSKSASNKCPANHSVYKKWYSSTGCWCITQSWGTYACCDCMPSGKSGDSNACGCSTSI